MSFPYENDVTHAVTVAKLRELLSAIRDDDLLFPNDVHNLAIHRDGEYIGYVDLGFDRVEI